MKELDRIISNLVFLLVILAFLALTAWTFSITRNPWSFAILVMLFGFKMTNSFTENDKDEEEDIKA